ncbi:MAG TPA: hypothetical protein DEW22_03260 [Clostridiales bacterium]|nr:hypothetical protein [Clostridiales bacterium]
MGRRNARKMRKSRSRKSIEMKKGKKRRDKGDRNASSSARLNEPRWWFRILSGRPTQKGDASPLFALVWRMGRRNARKMRQSRSRKPIEMNKEKIWRDKGDRNASSHVGGDVYPSAVQ